VSNGERANKATPDSAIGTVRLARTPTLEKSRMPETRRARHPFSALTPSGTSDLTQTTDDSSELGEHLLAVGPEVHRRGIGTALLREAVDLDRQTRSEEKIRAASLV
jgi:GNAT superfamily N-acetyltransferase